MKVILAEIKCESTSRRDSQGCGVNHCRAELMFQNGKIAFLFDFERSAAFKIPVTEGCHSIDCSH